MINGVVNIRKEKGMTSFGVVSRLRKIFDQRKIGHTGTLDPDAEGVLPVCLGRATHLVEPLSRGTKGYEAVLLLGRVTDTQDAGGKILRESPVTVTPEEVREAVLSFTGKQKQLPPMYSAIKQNGKKLVDLARKGIEVERSERDVEFHEIGILGIDLPRVTFRVTCSHGTYIRTLCHDIGEKLGCGACMESLLRTRVGEFEIGDALTLGELEERKKSEDSARTPGAGEESGDLDRTTAPYSFIRSIDSFYSGLPRVTVGEEALKTVLNGRGFRPEECPGGFPALGEKDEARAYTPAGEFIGIYRRKGEELRLVRFFYEDRK